MLLFFVITAISLGFIPISIFTKKKKIPQGIGAFSSLLLGMALLFNLASVTYHAFGNQKAYEAIALKREELISSYTETKDDPELQNEFKKTTKEIRWFNEELVQNKEMANSIWLNWYSYSYASEHFSELVITL